MEITKARLKQIIMEEIQKFIVVEQDDELDSKEAKEAAAEAAAKKAETETDPDAKAAALRTAADILTTPDK